MRNKIKRNKIKKIGLLVLALSMMTSPLQYLNAQSTAAAVVAGGQGQTFIGGAGTYNFQKINLGVLMEKILKNFTETQMADRQYVIDTVNSINAQFSELVETELVGPKGLQTLSILSVTSESFDVPLSDFLGAQARYKASLILLQNKIESLTEIPSVTKEANATTSAEMISEDGKKTSIPVRVVGNIDFQPVIDHYQSQINSLKKQISELKIRLRLPNGSIVSQGVTEALDLSNIYSAAQMNEMQKEIKKLQTIPADISMALDSYNQTLAMQLTESIRTFGTTEKSRYQTNPEGAQKNLNMLVEAFWMRSWLRATYGLKLGAIGLVNSNGKRYFNLDFFSSKNKFRFASESFRNQLDLTFAQDAIANLLVTQDSRAKKVFAKDIDFLSRVNSAITWLRGETPLVTINTEILKLLAADIDEELTLGRTGGLKQVREIYRTRYYTSDAEKARIKAMAAQVSGKGSASDDDVQVAGFEDNRSAIFTIQSSLNMMLNNLVQADNLAAVFEVWKSKQTAYQKLDERQGNL